mmetsp:Transcript_53095/g.93252  ORF Transcript_53095/g.93252 Transcript_53095/m.93252 type:complete len:215 (-) Transcript_53095:8-652(-)
MRHRLPCGGVVPGSLGLRIFQQLLQLTYSQLVCRMLPMVPIVFVLGLQYLLLQILKSTTMFTMLFCMVGNFIQEPLNSLVFALMVTSMNLQLTMQVLDLNFKFPSPGSVQGRLILVATGLLFEFCNALLCLFKQRKPATKLSLGCRDPITCHHALGLDRKIPLGGQLLNPHLQSLAIFHHCAEVCLQLLHVFLRSCTRLQGFSAREPLTIESSL